MIKTDFYDRERNLMITTTDNPTKNLRKVGTDEIYTEAVDVIEGVVVVDGKEAPYCRFTYVEVEAPEESIDSEVSEEV